ncbi:MAG TPA: PH domain-containing protein [Chitinophagaceae bacterium]|nr:PH domain-containing protein [Chitinophagaceae bacterium]
MKNFSDNYEDWETPQRQSPAAIFIMLVKTALQLFKGIWPILIVIVFRKKNDTASYTILLIILGFVIISLIVTLIRYLFFRFHIKNNNFIIETGWLQKKTLSIPLQNIHAVNLEQGLWQQVFKVTKITLDSSGSEKVEGKIHALAIRKAELLKHLLLARAENKEPETADTFPKRTALHKLSNADLFKLSLSANHLEAFFILLGLSLNALDDIKKIIKVDEEKLIRSYADTILNQTFFVAGIIFIAVAIISIITSIIRTILKYYNFTIEETGFSWKISFGLLTTHQKIIPFNKIQILSWKANWLRRKINFWVLHVQSIGHDETKRKQHLQIPVTSFNSILSLYSAYQRSPVIKDGEGLQIEPAYWKRKLLIIGLPMTLILSLALYFWVGSPGFIALFLLFYLAWYYRTWYKNFRWKVNEEGLQLYSGVWGRKYTLLTWKKVQQVQINQNLYQRSHQLASIIFITAGGSVGIPYIQYNTAKELADNVLYLVESKNENWM